MDTIRKALIAVLILGFAFGVAGASAQLTSTAWGFPTIVQSSDTVAFVQDTADALSFEEIDISFPTACGGLPFGAVGLAFPSIHQTSLQTQSVAHTSYVQTSEYAAFSYPFIGVGTAGLPGFCF